MKGVWDKVNSGLNFLFGIAGIIMVLVASYAVLARNVLLVSTPWSDELLKRFLSGQLYGVRSTVHECELISLTLLEDKYKESKPKVYGSLKAIQYVAAVGISALLTSQLFTIVSTQMNTGEATTVLKYPLWVMNLGMLLGLGLIAIYGVVKVIALKPVFYKKRRFNTVKKFGTKQLIPLAMALMGIIFAWIGFTQLGFWEKEPKAGFFPTIIAIVLVIASIAAFFQTLKEEDKPSYNKDELLVIAGGAAVIAEVYYRYDSDAVPVCIILAEGDRKRNSMETCNHY